MKTLAMIKYTLHEYLHGIGLMVLLLVFGMIFVSLAVGLKVEKEITGDKVTFFGQELVPEDAGPEMQVFEGVGTAVVLQMLFVALATALGGPMFLILIGSRVVESMLTQGNRHLLLSKPMYRWHLFLARLAGFMFFTAIIVYVFATGLWLIVGIKTGCFIYQPFVAAPIILLIYLSLVAVIALISVLTENFFVAAGGTVGFYTLAMIMGHPEMVDFFESGTMLHFFWTVIHGVLPKISELNGFVGGLYLPENPIDWVTPVWTTAVFCVVVIAVTAFLFTRKEY